MIQNVLTILTRHMRKIAKKLGQTGSWNSYFFYLFST